MHRWKQNFDTNECRQEGNRLGGIQTQRDTDTYIETQRDLRAERHRHREMQRQT